MSWSLSKTSADLEENTNCGFIKYNEKNVSQEKSLVSCLSVWSRPKMSEGKPWYDKKINKC